MRPVHQNDYPDEWFAGETLGRQDVARIFKVDASTITNWAKQGRIGFFRTPTGVRVFPECEVRRVARGEMPSDFVKQHAVRDAEEYAKKWEEGWHNNGLGQYNFQRKQKPADE